MIYRSYNKNPQPKAEDFYVEFLGWLGYNKLDYGCIRTSAKNHFHVCFGHMHRQFYQLPDLAAQQQHAHYERPQPMRSLRADAPVV